MAQLDFDDNKWQVQLMIDRIAPEVKKLSMETNNINTYAMMNGINIDWVECKVINNEKEG